MDKKKIVIIATEPSGDYLGSKLMIELKKKNPNIMFYGIGGELMYQNGINSIIPIKKLSVNGIFEVLMKLFSFMNYINITKRFIQKIKPDILVTIDSPSFNYRLVQKLQGLRGETKFFHYVAPTVWAWKKYRAKKFSKLYDTLLCLFSFETVYFTKHNLKSIFVGHPIFFEKRKFIKSRKKIITFFPGSRLNEISKIMPIFLKSMILFSREKKNYELKIITIPSLKKDVKNIIGDKKFEIIDNLNLKKKMIENSFLSVAASGTISLELASYKIPMIVVYKSNYLTSLIIKNFVNLNWCSLVNIIYDKEIIPELLFDNFNHFTLLNKIEDCISNPEIRDKQKNYFEKLPKLMLKNSINPSLLAAKAILGLK
ncbi:lipid-A-disaccharide synthase [Rickettsiales bacterium]|nr:lipid-A-disaccharide synthase [Rickettsiales bacterium]